MHHTDKRANIADFFPLAAPCDITGCILHHRKGPACGRGSRNRYGLFHDRLQRYSLYSMNLFLGVLFFRLLEILIIQKFRERRHPFTESSYGNRTVLQ